MGVVITYFTYIVLIVYYCMLLTQFNISTIKYIKNNCELTHVYTNAIY